MKIKMSILILLTLSFVGCGDFTPDRHEIERRNLNRLIEVTPTSAPHMVCVYLRITGGLECFRKEKDSER